MIGQMVIIRHELPAALGTVGQAPRHRPATRSELSSETKDNSVAILLTYGTACILLAGDAEAREST
jgi:hypothetical protein